MLIKYITKAFPVPFPFIFTFTASILLALLTTGVFSLSGCHKKELPVLQPPPKQDVIHRVQYPGESLSIIAHWYTGKALNWKVILSANPKLKSAERLHLGEEIFIPGGLVVKNTAFSKEEFTQYFKKGRNEDLSGKVTPGDTPWIIPSVTPVDEKGVDTTHSISTPPPSSSPSLSPSEDALIQKEEASPSDIPTPLAIINDFPKAIPLTPAPELPTPNPNEIARDKIIDEIIGGK